jgi:hypothetical protein
MESDVTRPAASSLIRLSSATAAALLASTAWGQTATPSSGGAAGAAAATPTPQPGSTFIEPGRFGFPESGNGTIGGGNATESSAHPVTGDTEDTFDFGTHGAGGDSVHGSDNGPIFFSNRPAPIPGEVPSSYVVRRGDTLWGICDQYYRNPYEWPRLWSYNPDVKNPNWIYPGDELHLKASAPGGSGADATGTVDAISAPAARATQTLGGFVDRRHARIRDTIFLRDQGWIQDGSDEVWGEITGAAADKMFLSDLDEIYVRIDPGHAVHLGQELTIFRPIRAATAGTIVQIQGTARIDQFSTADRVARAQVVEALNVIERGAKVGPLARSFEVVPAVRDTADVHAHVLASVNPNEFFGQNQVVFIDKGSAAGLAPGNRLVILRRGDAWRSTLLAPIAGYRVSPDDDKPMPPMENTPGTRKDDKTLPEETIAELRVIATRKDTSTCMVVQARKEIEIGDSVVARKGY